jgi:hypothetical protein
MYEVLEGLRPGDRVATSGVFLIAAEARISTAAEYWDKADDTAEMKPAQASPEGMPSAGPAMPIPKPAASVSPKRKDGTMRPASAVYSCPMHPEVRSSAPGKCPKCGMDLERLPSGGSK